MSNLWFPPVSLNPTPISMASRPNQDQNILPKSSEYFPLESAKTLCRPHQSIPQANQSLSLYGWTLPEMNLLEQLAHVLPGSFQKRSTSIGLLFSARITPGNNVCRIPIYLSRGLVRVGVYYIGTQTFTESQLSQIQIGHKLLCQLLWELVTRSLQSVSDSDGTQKNPGIDQSYLGSGALFDPENSRCLCYLVFLTEDKTVKVSLEATQNLILWDKSRRRFNNVSQGNTASSAPLIPKCGIVTTYRCLLPQIDPFYRSGLLIRPRSCPPVDKGVFATSFGVKQCAETTVSIECSRLSRHLTSGRVTSGVNPTKTKRSAPQPLSYPVNECVVHPLSAWLWFNLSLVPRILHQLNRALLIIEFREELNTLVHNYTEPTPMAVLIPDRVDAPIGMLHKLYESTELDRDVCLHDHRQLQDSLIIQRMALDNNLPSLPQLLEATTSLGACDAVNLECLEFLGDSFLQFVATLTVYRRLPSETREGMLTGARSSLVSNNSLRSIAVSRRWYRFCSTQPFDLPDHFLPPCYNVTAPSRSKDRRLFALYTEKSLADVVEAVLGCFLRYCGLSKACALIESILDVDNPMDQAMWMSLKCNTAQLSIADLLVQAVHLNSRPKSDSETPGHLCADILGYRFTNLSLLQTALTHSSAPRVNESTTYERLEFLGDAVLGFVLSMYLSDTYPDYDPGQFTSHRSHLVNNNILAYTVVKRKVHPYILHKVDSLFDVIGKIEKIDASQLDSLEQITARVQMISSGLPVKLLADVFESLVGAVFVDSQGDLSVTTKVIHRLLGDLLYLRLS